MVRRKRGNRAGEQAHLGGSGGSADPLVAEVEISGRKQRSSAPPGPPGHLFDAADPAWLAEIADQAPILPENAVRNYKEGAEARVAEYMGRKLFEKTRQALADKAETLRKMGADPTRVFKAEEWPDWEDQTEQAREIWRNRAFQR